MAREPPKALDMDNARKSFVNRLQKPEHYHSKTPPSDQALVVTEQVVQIEDAATEGSDLVSVRPSDSLNPLASSFASPAHKTEAGESGLFSNEESSQ